MVKKPGGDIEGLFRSFGSDGGSYRELAREADAQAAQERWPMLGQIPAEAGARPKALDAAAKKHWRDGGDTGHGHGLKAPAPTSEGKRLMGGLDHLLQRGGAPASKAAVPPHPDDQRSGGRPMPQATPKARGFFERGPRPTRQNHPADASPPKKQGLFSGFGRSVKADEEARASPLSDVFSRLEGTGAAKRLGVGRPRKR